MAETYVNPNRAWQETVGTPAAQTPVTPTPQQGTPTAPYVNPNAAMQVPPAQPPVTVNVGTPPTTDTAPTGIPQGTAQPTLAMPQTGSVVDLLNVAGQDSSYTARQQLAQQYGIQNYSGTAAQNEELSKKYLETYNQLKGTAVPESPAGARDALSTYQDGTTKEPGVDPQQAFFDAYSGMNPVVKSLYDQLNTILSSTGTKQTFTEEFNNLRKEQGIEGLSTELMNIKNVMGGTEDDIRTEITKVGGFATESQVQALVASRNKTLMKQAVHLSDQLQLRNDYIDQVMRLSGMDRAQVEKDVDKKLGIVEKITTIQNQMDTATRSNYQNIVTNVGYEGLAKGLQGNLQLQNHVEKIFGLPKGSLTAGSAFLTAQSTKNLPASAQEYEYARKQGYKGTYEQYQNEDANRKKAIARAGVGSFTPAQISTTVNQIAGSFDNEPIVKQFNVINEGYQFAKSLPNATTNPSDDMGLIYAFAKIMDPNSVVREGEYNTVQKYAQSWVQSFGKSVSQAINGTGFLSEDARTNIKKTLEQRYAASKDNYDNVYSQYQKRISNAEAGKGNTLTDYSQAYTSPASLVGQIINYKGKRYQTDANGNFDPNKPL